MVAKKKTEEAVAVAEETAEAAVEGTPESEEVSATSPEEKGEEEVVETLPEEEKKDTFQERVDELTRKQRQAERERDEARRDRDDWRGMAQRFDEGKEPTMKEIEKAAKLPEEPKLEDFEDENYDAYYRALAKWEVQQQTAEIAEAIKKDLRADKEKDEATRRDEEVQEKFDEGRKKHEDFDAVALSKSVPYSDSSQAAVLASPNAAELAYFLGQNPDIADRISRLSSLDAAREIGIIEAGLKEKKPPVKVKESTKASEPINPVGSSETVEKSIYDEDISQRDYETLRAKQIAERRKR